jgi:tRNA dimethylallyltransferase
MKERLIAIVGPTAVGKTKVSVELAKAIDGEIINGDSMQVYKDMDIGTAKPTKQEMDEIPHHLFDFLEPTESFSVADFQSLAKPVVTNVNEKEKIPILVGGTGLYVKALTQDYQFRSDDSAPAYREKLEKFAEENGKDLLHDKLKTVDPEAADNTHPNNVRRVIRALEIHHTTGMPPSYDNNEKEKNSPYDLIPIGLTMERETLYERINRRVDQMVEDGLIEEAKSLYTGGVRDCQSVQGIGYKEIYLYLQGELTKEEAILLLKRNSRRYAKRQFTWFRNQMNVRWFEMEESGFSKKVTEIKQFVAGKC